MSPAPCALRPFNQPLRKHTGACGRSMSWLPIQVFRRTPVTYKTQPFRNYGVLTDHIERVDIRSDGLKPISKEVKVLHIEGTESGWLDRKEIEFEALIYLDPIYEKANELTFKTYYYASKSNEVYGGGMTVLRWETKK